MHQDTVLRLDGLEDHPGVTVMRETVTGILHVTTVTIQEPGIVTHVMLGHGLRVIEDVTETPRVGIPLVRETSLLRRNTPWVKNVWLGKKASGVLVQLGSQAVRKTTRET